MMILSPEKTAIVNGTSKSTLALERHSEKQHTILDYGAGKLRNAKFLLKKGYSVSILDTYAQLNKANVSELASYKHVFVSEFYQPLELFDRVLCSFVLNVIEDKENREKLLVSIFESMNDTALLFIEVRRKQGILQNKYKEPYKDGYVIGKNKVKTFQKPFEKEELAELLLSVGFDVLEINTLPDSILARAKKANKRRSE